MKSILIALILSCPLWAFSQENEGVIRYLMTQNWAKKIAAVDYISQQQKDKSSYMAGNDSEWKKYTTLYFNATETKYEDSEEKAEPDDEGYSWRKEIYYIKHNYAANTMYDVMQVFGKTYIVEDTLRAPDWKILNDLKEVAGHICMKASWVDTLKQQKVIAWFAMDIPLSAGPERLYGLPGLILEVDVNDGGMLVSADKIDLKKISTELDLPKKLKGKKISEVEYTALLKKHMDQKKEAEEPPFWGIRY